MTTHEGRFNQDFLVALIGSLLLFATLTGIFWIERDVESLEVTWENEILYEDSEEREAVLGADADRFPFQLDTAPRVIEFLDVIVEWTQADTDKFRVSITAPNGTVETIEGSGGQIWRTITVGNGGPASFRYNGDDQQAAIDAAWHQHDEEARQAGQGTWEVSVQLIEAPRELLPGVDDPQLTPSSDYSINLEVQGWQPVVRTVT